MIRSFCPRWAARAAITPGLGPRAFFVSTRSSHTHTKPLSFPLLGTEKAKWSVASTAPGIERAMRRTSARVAIVALGGYRPCFDSLAALTVGPESHRRPRHAVLRWRRDWNNSVRGVHWRSRVVD